MMSRKWYKTEDSYNQKLISSYVDYHSLAPCITLQGSPVYLETSFPYLLQKNSVCEIAYDDVSYVS